MNDTEYWLWLSLVFGIGNRRIWEVMCLFDSAGEAYAELVSGFLNDRLSEDEIERIKSTSVEQAAEQIEKFKEQGISAVAYSSVDYPKLLRHTFNPPAVLYYKGDISCLNNTATVTCVGTRHACGYSLDAAGRICRELAENGVVIVSGFAVGIDIVSQMAAASGGFRTAAVMGCGIDIDYPKENFQYRERVINSGGVLVSEYLPGTAPFSGNFPKRNRILSALGRICIVFEASEKSGSLITANMALAQGKEIFCLPPADIFSGRFKGNINMLRDGAAALFSAGDILDCLYEKKIVNIEADDFFYGMSSFGIDEIRSKSKNKIRPKSKKNKKHDKLNSTENTEIAPDNGLDEMQKKIIEILKPGTLHIDELADMLNMDTADIMTELTELELLGMVESLPGKFFELAE